MDLEDRGRTDLAWRFLNRYPKQPAITPSSPSALLSRLPVAGAREGPSHAVADQAQREIAAVPRCPQPHAARAALRRRNGRRSSSPAASRGAARPLRRSGSSSVSGRSDCVPTWSANGYTASHRLRRAGQLAGAYSQSSSRYRRRLAELAQGITSRLSRSHRMRPFSSEPSVSFPGRRRAARCAVSHSGTFTRRWKHCAPGSFSAARLRAGRLPPRPIFSGLEHHGDAAAAHPSRNPTLPSGPVVRHAASVARNGNPSSVACDAWRAERRPAPSDPASAFWPGRDRLR